MKTVCPKCFGDVLEPLQDYANKSNPFVKTSTMGYRCKECGHKGNDFIKEK